MSGEGRVWQSGKSVPGPMIEARALSTEVRHLAPKPPVSPSLKEPVCGWIDNVYGPNGAGIGAFAGLLRTGVIHAETKLNMIPVDMVANCIIAAAFGATTR
uniref:Fatty acyl-CoA reductase n=1 Tax=Timema shepardi TaxID=629360 RepID=A0A7R9G0U5_TIMSH|nr:unnamed protein product [Timema shepardi]